MSPVVKSLEQYTINIPIIATGRISPKYFMNFGISFDAPNNANGNSLVANVHTAATKTIIIV